MRQSLPLFQQFARGHSPRGDDVYPLSAVVTASRGSSCSNAVSISVTRRCGSGGTGLGRCLQSRSGNTAFIIDPIRTGAGILMRCLSGSTERCTISGALSITKGRYSKLLATKRRDRKAALRFLKRTMKRYGRPKVIVTDRLKSYRAAMNVIGNAAAQTCGQWLNNRAENSHQPFRRREGAMARFRDIKDPAEVCCHPRLYPQSFQSGTSSL